MILFTDEEIFEVYQEEIEEKWNAIRDIPYPSKIPRLDDDYDYSIDDDNNIDPF
jgi:hypothetical protein